MNVKTAHSDNIRNIDFLPCADANQPLNYWIGPATPTTMF